MIVTAIVPALQAVPSRCASLPPAATLAVGEVYEVYEVCEVCDECLVIVHVRVTIRTATYTSRSAAIWR
jgi:hypothetical protein